MMQELSTENRVTAPDLLRVYFFAPDNSLFARAITDYHKLFGEDAFVVHCVVQLGNQVYEVALDGTFSYPYTTELDNHERLLSYYELELNNISEDKRYAAEFMLRSWVTENKKFDWRGCLKYAANFLFIPKRDRLAPEYHNFNAPASSVKIVKSKANTKMLMFNLPYTCASQVLYVICKLFDIVPLYSGHLPACLYGVLSSLDELGIGKLWTNESAFEVGDY